MTQLNTETNTIEVHSREALVLPYSRWTTNGTTETQVDISASEIYIEIPGINLRRQLVINPTDALGLLIKLDRTDVEKLPLTPIPFVVVDETTDPDVEWRGKIYRSGDKGQPTA